MGVNLQLLGLQAIPRLAKKFNVKLEGFMALSDLYGRTPEGFQAAYKDCGKILNRFFEEFHVSWWDVYLNSDIGMERMALAKEIGLKEGDVVLDVGCGRGYFTIAAAKLVKEVVGLDIMDGGGRYGWWSNFKEAIVELKLTDKVSGLKADAQSVPLKDCSVDKAVAVHSIRNFQDERAIQNAMREMNRVISKDGEMVIVESIPIARNKAQEAHLALYRCKCKYSSGDLFYFTQEELLEMLEKAGLRGADSKVIDYNLSATPPIFYLNASLLKEERIKDAQMEYDKAIDLIKRHGEVSPPAVIIRVSKS